MRLSLVALSSDEKMKEMSHSFGPYCEARREHDKLVTDLTFVKGAKRAIEYFSG